MKRESLLKIQLRASLAAAQVCASLQSFFAWASARCDDLNTFFLAKSAKYRR